MEFKYFTYLMQTGVLVLQMIFLYHTYMEYKKAAETRRELSKKLLEQNK